MNKGAIAKLTSENTIEVYVSNKFNNYENKSFSLICNDKFMETLKCLSKSKSGEFCIYTLLTSKNILVGNDYKLKDDSNEYINLDIFYFTLKDNFYDKYKFDGPLGNIYSKQQTTFRVFSPMATEVILNITPFDKNKSIFYMEKKENGIFEITLQGDYDKAKYYYIIKLMGEYVETLDPYCFSCDTNSRHSYVVDIEKIKSINSNLDKLPVLNNYNDHIIYECSIRDMTSLTNLSYKGTYQALTNENLKDHNNIHIGMDYIKELGITTVQLLPIFDFQTIDDEHPFRNYNWGYDPKLFFVPEGSFSSNPEDPYARLIELKNLISTFHKNGIRVVMDVVYNHVFSVKSNPLDIICPNYYFRLNHDNSYSNGSGCGNDIESRHYMVRKLIIDSLIYFTEVFGIDGYRFDLMGILDKETMNEIYKRLSSIRKDIIIYGEGWDLMTNLPSTEKASMNNAFDMKNIGFFNDRFRDIVKGKSSSYELSVKGYLTSDVNYIDGFKNVYLGSVLPISYPPLFENACQSINYVECHDNSTLYDKLTLCCPEDTQQDRIKRINIINACCMFSFGVPFFHMGQEIGLSKKGETNSYNLTDEINGLNYQEAYNRREMLRFFKHLVEVRKRLNCFKMYTKEDLFEHISFQNLEKGAIMIKYSFEKEEYYIIFNPSKERFTCTFDRYVKVLFNNTGVVSDSYEFYSQNYLVNGLSVSILYSEK